MNKFFILFCFLSLNSFAQTILNTESLFKEIDSTYSIKVNADKDETSRIILFSITGQQVFEKEFKINKGNNSLTVNPEISNGVYLLHYISNNETIIKKIIKD